jgi:Bax protein
MRVQPWLLILLLTLLPATASAGNQIECVSPKDRDGYPLGKQEDQFIQELLIKVEENFESDSEKVKKEFLKKLTPLVIHVISRVEKERDFLGRTCKPGAVLGNEDQSQLNELKEKYRTDDLKELRKRVNVVPLDLVLAQAAEESGWGRSKAATNCNNFFGVHAGGNLPSCHKGNKVIARFDSPEAAIEFYVLNLNRNDAYESFRQERQRILDKGQVPTGKALAQALRGYAKNSEKYSRKVGSLIQDNNLHGMVQGAIGEVQSDSQKDTKLLANEPDSPPPLPKSDIPSAKSKESRKPARTSKKK